MRNGRIVGFWCAAALLAACGSSENALPATSAGTGAAGLAAAVAGMGAPAAPAGGTTAAAGSGGSAADGGVAGAAGQSITTAGTMADSGKSAEPDDADGGVAQVDAGSVPVRADVRCKADATLPQRTDYSQAGRYAVGTMDMMFEDTSRAIAATGTHPAAPSRRLPTTIYYPATSAPGPLAAASLAAGGPFPMLMYSHGYSSSRAEAVPAATHAASYGYIVVVPEFPLTNLLAEGGADIHDAVNQPKDVSYVIDQMLAASKNSAHVLAGGIDDARIGAVGVSLGGLTTLLVSFHPKLHDARIKAALPIAPASSFFAEGFYHTRELPMLIVHGDLDAFLDYQSNGRRSFTRAAPNARLVTVHKGTHAAFGATFDPATLPGINALIGAAGADPSNADGIGCGAVGASLSMTGPDFVETLGGPDDFIALADAAPPPCLGDEYKRPALDPTVQEQIAVRSVVSFFEAHLGKTPEVRQDGCRYLLHELPKNSALSLE